VGRLAAGRFAEGRFAAGRLAAGRFAEGRFAAGRFAPGRLAAGCFAVARFRGRAGARRGSASELSRHPPRSLTSRTRSVEGFWPFAVLRTVAVAVDPWTWTLVTVSVGCSTSESPVRITDSHGTPTERIFVVSASASRSLQTAV